MGDLSTKPGFTFPKFLLILLLILGFIICFITGFFLNPLLSNQTKTDKTTSNVKPLPTPVIDKTNETAQEITKFLPGKAYFDDTVMLVSKKDPAVSLIATATRNQQEKGYVQNTRVSVFDGKSWARKTGQATTDTSTIVSGTIVKNWTTETDPSRVLKEKSSGEINLNDLQIKFSTNTLQNEISVRSQPGYTKFMSNGEGTLTINNQSYPAYVLYTRIYSLNASEIQFYDQPFGLTTDWVAFWDENGNFYHVDTTSVSKPTDIYKTHKLGVMETNTGSVLKTFAVTTTRDQITPPDKYTFNLQNPVDVTLNLERLNSLNKAPNNSYKWFVGQVKGTATLNGQTINGVGIVEYINN